MVPDHKPGLSQILGMIVGLTGAIVIVGWLIDIPALTTVIPGYVPMKFNTACCFLASGISILYLFSDTIFKKNTGKILAAMVALAGLLTLLQYGIGFNLGIDELLWIQRTSGPIDHPGRMSPATALNLLAAGTALFLLYLHRFQQIIQLLTFLIAGVAILALLNNNFNIDYRSNLPFFSNMAVHTAINFFFLATAILVVPWVRTASFPFEWKLIGTVAFASLVLIAFFYLFNKSNADFIQSAREEENIHDVLYESEQIMVRATDMESNSRGFLLTGDERLLTQFNISRDSARVDMNTLVSLTRNDFVLQKRLDTLQKLLSQLIAFEETLHDLKIENKSGEAIRLIEKGIGLTTLRDIWSVNKRITSDQNQRLEKNKLVNQQHISRAIRATLFFLAVGALMLMVIYLQVQNNLRARNKAERELEESEEWFATVLSSIGDGVIVADKNGDIIFMNPASRSLTRWGNEAYGKPVELIYPLIRENSKELMENPVSKAINEKQVVGTAEYKTLVRKDNSEIFVHDSVAPVIDDDGQISGAVLVFRDVTAQRKSEATIRYNALLLENISYAVVSTDINQRILTMNKDAELLYGYTQEELKGKLMKEALGAEYPDSSEENIKGILFESGNWKGNLVLHSKNGKRINVLASVALLKDDNGRIIGTVNVHKDITERLQAEERIKYQASLIEQTSDAIFSIDNNSTIISWNQGAEKMYGYRQEETIGRNAKEITQTAFSPEDFERIDEQIRQFNTWSGDGIHRDRMGNIIYVYITISTIKTLGPQPTGFVLIVKNITEKRKLEEQLRRFNQELELEVNEKTREIKDVFERVSDGFVAFDNNWKFTYINKKAGNIFHMAPEELIGKSVWDIIPGAVGSKFYITCQEAMQQQKYTFLEDYSKIFDFWFEAHLYPSPRGLSAYFRDISEKKKAEDLLLTSEESRRLIVSSAMDAIICTDMSGNITVWNRQAEKIFGWKEEEILGMNLAETIVPIAYRESHKKGMSHYAKTGEGPVLNKINEMYALKRTGEEFPVELTIIPIQQKGREFFCAFIRDISERKKTEKKLQEERTLLRTLIDNLPDYIYVKDTSFRHIINNTSNVNLIGAASEKETLGKTAFDYFEESVAQAILADDEYVFKTGKPIISQEELIKTRSGEERWLLTTKVPLPDQNRKTSMLIGISRDITEIKKAQKELENSNARFEMISRTTNDAIWEWNLETNSIWVNEMHQHLYGLTLRDPVPDQEEWKKRIHPDDRDQTTRGLDEAIASEKNVWISEYRFLTTNDEYKTIYDRTYIVRDNSGKPLRLLGSMMDITARKKAEEQIIKEKELSDFIINSLPGVFYFYDENLKLIRWNRQLEAITGYTSPELSEMNPQYLFDGEDRIHMIERSKKVFQLGAGDAEASFISKEGKKIPFYFTGMRMLFENKPSILGIGIDITDRKKMELTLRQSEEKYRQLFSSSPLPMWVFEISTLRFLDVNEAAVLHYGYQREEFLQMTVKDIRPPEEVERLIAQTKESKSGVRRTGTWKHKKKDGQLIDVEVNSHDILFNQKSARLVLANDVTEKVKSQQLILDTSKQLRELTARLHEIREEERMHMAHEIHDELGQRLTVLKMDISWLNRKLITEDEMAKEKIRNTLTLLDGTIKIVRKIATDLRPGILDDLGLIPALEWQSKDFEGWSGINASFHSNISEIVLPELVSTSLFRIFQESLTNVARHSEARHIDSELLVKEDQITLTIIDDGKGFNTAALGNKKTLGIMGMKERTMGIGGEYTIRSIPGKGTVVSVQVPYSRDK